MAWLYYGNGMMLYQEMYDQAGFNVHILPCAIVAPEASGWFAKEINSPEDLKDLKMLFIGPGSKVIQKLGVAMSLLPGGQIQLLPRLAPTGDCVRTAVQQRFLEWRVRTASSDY